MIAGLEITHDDGTILLDVNVHTLAVVSQGTYPQNPLPAGEINKMLARAMPAIDSSSYQWWEFGHPVSSPNYGLQLFGADGSLLYCAATKVARVVDVFQVGMWGRPAVVRSYAPGKTYAAFMSGNQFTDTQLRGAGINQEYRIVRWVAYATVNGTTVTSGWYSTILTDWTPVPPEGVSTFPSPAYDPWIVILDVTNY